MPASSNPKLPICGVSAASAACWPATGPTAAPAGLSAGGAATAEEKANRLPASSSKDLDVIAGNRAKSAYDNGLARGTAHARPRIETTKRPCRQRGPQFGSGRGEKACFRERQRG